MKKQQAIKILIYALAMLILGFAIFCIFWGDAKWLERTAKMSGYFALPIGVFLMSPHYILARLKKTSEPTKKQRQTKFLRALNVYHNCVGSTFLAFTALHISSCLAYSIATNGHLYSFDYITGWLCLIILAISCVYGFILRKNTLAYKLKHFQFAKAMCIMAIVHILCIFIFKYIISNFI